MSSPSLGAAGVEVVSVVWVAGSELDGVIDSAGLGVDFGFGFGFGFSVGLGLGVGFFFGVGIWGAGSGVFSAVSS